MLLVLGTFLFFFVLVFLAGGQGRFFYPFKYYCYQIISLFICAIRDYIISPSLSFLSRSLSCCLSCLGGSICSILLLCSEDTPALLSGSRNRRYGLIRSWSFRRRRGSFIGLWNSLYFMWFTYCCTLVDVLETKIVGTICVTCRVVLGRVVKTTPSSTVQDIL